MDDRLRVGDKVEIRGRVVAVFPDDDCAYRVEFRHPLFSMGGARVLDGEGPSTSYSVNAALLKRARHGHSEEE